MSQFEQELRAESLYKAITWSRGTDYSTEEVLQIADKFYAFVKDSQIIETPTAQVIDFPKKDA